MKKYIIPYLVFLFFVNCMAGRVKSKGIVDKVPEQAQSRLWYELLGHDSSWFGTQEALDIARNVLLYQEVSGGWPKNIVFSQKVSAVEEERLMANTRSPESTIDNGATYTQIRFLEKVFNSTRDPRFSDAALRGIDFLLEAQYENGGWPQYYPLRKGYYSRITFNDDAMAGVMRLLLDLVTNVAEFGFVDEGRREAAAHAIEKGIDCILRCQIEVDDTLTAWCAQHDETTYEPVKARSYELPSLSGRESVGIVGFLMSIQNPDSNIVEAVQSAVAWLDQVKIYNVRVVRNMDPEDGAILDKYIVTDSTAPPMWARFYEIGTNRPFFCNRDGRIHYSYSELTRERRKGYAWLGYWPLSLLEEKYPSWRKRWNPEYDVLENSK
ncbi:MAG: pectate lyase [candidate division KSB1 bacterium]|nr:pectate lyase [candidate division KSB1 bacterium]